MRILTLSGWGQPHDALAHVVPGAESLAYAQAASLKQALQDIAAAGRRHDIVIGWSLGGQLAVRAMAAGLFLPKKLVLVAAPFQFVATPESPLGMKRDMYEKFCANYLRDPQRTLRKSQALIAKGDAKGDAILPSPSPIGGGRGGGLIGESLASHAPLLTSPLRGEGMIDREIDWLYWLRALDSSCAGLDFRHFPPTLLVHGAQDAVVASAQSLHFATLLPQATLSVWSECGHAPHWHDPLRMRHVLEDFLHV